MPRKPKPRLPCVYAKVSPAEHRLLMELARRDGLTMSNFVRRCINAVLLEEGHERLLEEQQWGKGGRPAHA